MGMDKRCSKCKNLLPLKEFSKKTVGKLQPYCKQCCRDYQKEWYQNNKEKHKKSVRKNNVKYAGKARDFILEYLSSHPCVDCDETDPVVLTFDHVRGKKVAAISTMISSHSFNTIKEEIVKCEVRCCNCHQRKTSIERGWYKTKTA